MRTVVIYSGGLDSTVLLYTCRFAQPGGVVAALTVDYGQRHKKEIVSAKAICAKLGVDHEVVDISGILPLLRGSSQTDQGVAVPLGHYTDESMKKTVVPNRNMILIALGVAMAVSRGMDTVAYAAHAGDHAIYPDCREEFASAMNTAALLADWQKVRIERSFIRSSKADIVKMGNALGVPFQHTWSCYNGREAHCGMCGTCVERREAFTLAGVPDPTSYEQ